MRTSRTTSPVRRLVTAAAAISLLALTACNGSEPAAEADDPADATEQPATDEADEADAAEQPESDDAGADAIVARNINFEPAEITVEVGTEVTFTNEDIVRHTVTSGTPDAEDDAFDLSLDEEGDVVTFTFDEAGTYEFFCRLHPAMTGTVTVEG